MNSFRKTVSVTTLALTLSLTTAFAQEGDVEIVVPNGDWGENELMPLPPGYETPFDEWTEGIFFGNFMISNQSSSEICTMTLLANVGDYEIPAEFSVSDESGCLSSGNDAQVNYSVDSVKCDVYIEFLNKRDEVVASGDMNHCENTYITIN